MVPGSGGLELCVLHRHLQLQVLPPPQGKPSAPSPELSVVSGLSHSSALQTLHSLSLRLPCPLCPCLSKPCHSLLQAQLSGPYICTSVAFGLCVCAQEGALHSE